MKLLLLSYRGCYCTSRMPKACGEPRATSTNGFLTFPEIVEFFFPLNLYASDVSGFDIIIIQIFIARSESSTKREQRNHLERYILTWTVNQGRSLHSIKSLKNTTAMKSHFKCLTSFSTATVWLLLIFWWSHSALSQGLCLWHLTQLQLQT